MKIRWVLLVSILLTGTLEAQVIRRPPTGTTCECPEKESTYCILYPEACEACWAACNDVSAPWGRIIPSPRPVPTVDPTVDYYLPGGVGVTQVYYEPEEEKEVYQHFTTGAFFDQISEYGIRIAKIWLHGDYRQPEIWTHPSIDVIIVRFVSEGHVAYEDGCIGGTTRIWEEEPTEEIVRYLYENFSDQDKKIIITNWEGDWQWRGRGCRGATSTPPDSSFFINSCLEWVDGGTVEDCRVYYLQERLKYVANRANQRQIAVESVRSGHPDARLKVYHGMVVNFFDEDADYGYSVARNVIPFLERSPDFIGISWWNRNGRLTDSIRYVANWTGFPYYRMFIDEIGENQDHDQYDFLVTRLDSVLRLGVQLGCVWMWKQPWCNGEDLGLWHQTQPCSGKVSWDTPTRGLEAVQDLNERYQ